MSSNMRFWVAYIESTTSVLQQDQINAMLVSSFSVLNPDQPMFVISKSPAFPPRRQTEAVLAHGSIITQLGLDNSASASAQPSLVTGHDM